MLRLVNGSFLNGLEKVQVGFAAISLCEFRGIHFYFKIPRVRKEEREKASELRDDRSMGRAFETDS